jgi:hypothetical protein
MEDLPEYRITRVEADFSVPGEPSFWSAVPALTIHHYLWLDNGYKPHVEVRLCHSAQNLYVAVQDSAGKVAVVTDATAVNSPTWTEVQMPLSSFSGVSMSKVKKMFIGVGDRNNPVADGTGMLFIDDIRVIKP